MNTRLLTRTVCALTAVVVLAACQLSTADAAGVTGAKHPIAPVVTASSQFCAGKSASQQQLCGLQLQLGRVSHSDSFVHCSGCSGSWGAWSRAGETWSAKGTGELSASARVLLVVTEAGYVGRYRAYRLGGTPQHPGLVLAGQGCVAADVPASVMLTNSHGQLHKLPTVPCAAPKLKATVFVAGLNELSRTTPTHAIVYGTASKPMWLTIAQTTASGCEADPLAFSANQRNHQKIWYVFHVKGLYEEGFQTDALVASGRYCFYLQSGAQYEKYADGWVSQFTYNDYSTDDVLTGPAATALTAAGSTTVTLSGNAPQTETLDSYDELTPCPEFSELAQLNSFGGSTMQVSGAFTDTLTTGNFAQSGYVCSYLHDAGITVALSTDLVTITGSLLKDQTDYAETADTTLTPVSDPVGNVGTSGAVIAAGQTVHVRCILNGQGLAPYDPIWYELDSPPYGDAFYASSADFYNNGQTSGALSGGKLWDPAVKFCNQI
jgi:hypothetical protein